MIASLAGELVKNTARGTAGKTTNGIGHRRPFRAPHHSASMAALVGGGMHARPGEISLAHRGVLFLDELPEFPRGVLDSLRQPLETGDIVIARANVHVTYPARVQLVAAMNPCRCGYAGDLGRACARGERCVADYQAKLSGPLLDRIDLHIEVPPVSVADLSLSPPSEGSVEIAARVAAARARQYARQQDQGRPCLNAELTGDLLEKAVALDDAGRALMAQAADRMRLTARGYYRVLRVARTLADLDAAGSVSRRHIAEALAYRRSLPGARAAA